LGQGQADAFEILMAEAIDDPMVMMLNGDAFA
jgi:hypothetical protein